MSIKEITNKVNTLGNAWENFKQVNDARLREVERKGNSDPLYMEQLSRISNVLDNQKSRMNQLETAALRPEKEMAYESKSENRSEYTKAFNSYLRKGATSQLEGIEMKALSVGSGTDGGFLVTPKLSETIHKIVFESSPMRQICGIEQISTESLDIIVDNGSMGAGWTTETGVVNETTSAQIFKESILTFEMYAQPKATQRLIDDSAIDIEAWIAEKVGDIFSRTENTAFIAGNGTTQPKGILTYAAGTNWGQIQQVNSGTSAALTVNGLINLYYSLADEYARNSTFLMNRATVQAVRLLKDATSGQYLWQPSLAAGSPDTLMGLPVMQASDMPVPAANSLSVAVGDFKRAYKIVDRIGIRVLRDQFTEKPFVKYYTTKRVGGEVVDTNAIKLLRLAV